MVGVSESVSLWGMQEFSFDLTRDVSVSTPSSGPLSDQANCHQTGPCGWWGQQRIRPPMARKEAPSPGRSCVRFIMAGDICGYCKLMDADEFTAQSVVEERIFQILAYVQYLGGEMIQVAGDNFIALFQSVGSALGVADMIHHTEDRSNKLADVKFRLGIHKGLIHESGGWRFGQAINIASRIEQLSQAGVTLVSDQVLNGYEDRLARMTHPLGAYKLKNIESPVTIYRIKR